MRGEGAETPGFWVGGEKVVVKTHESPFEKSKVVPILDKTNGIFAKKIKFAYK